MLSSYKSIIYVYTSRVRRVASRARSPGALRPGITISHDACREITYTYHMIDASIGMLKSTSKSGSYC